MSVKVDNGKRYTIGFLTEYMLNQIKDEMKEKLLEGAIEAAKEQDNNFLCFIGTSSDVAVQSSIAVNRMFKLMNQCQLDGLFFESWTASVCGVYRQKFLYNFNSYPMVSIGFFSEECPRVYVFGGKYVEEMVYHLYEIHGKKRIVFVDGLISDRRIDHYCKAAKAKGIYDSNLIVGIEDLKGVSHNQRGKRTVEILMDERGLNFDAVCCMRSYDIIGLVKELTARGKSVPADVAMITYEDDNFARSHIPSITAMYYPNKEIGYCCYNRVVDLLNKEERPHITEVPTTITMRPSCGCSSKSMMDAAFLRRFKDNNYLSNLQRTEKADRVNKLFKDGNNAAFDIHLVTNCFLKDLQSKTDAASIEILEKQFNKIEDNDDLERILSVIENIIIPNVVDDKEDILWAQGILGKLQNIAQRRKISLFQIKQINSKRFASLLQGTCQNLVSNFSTEELLWQLERSLPMIQVPKCLLFLFNEKRENYNDCTLIFEYINDKRRKSSLNNRGAARELLKQALPKDQRYSFIINPLVVDGEYLGFAFFEPGPLDIRIYESLSKQISTALKSSMLIEELESFNKKIISTQEELVRNAHRAGMAQIATDTLDNVSNVLRCVNNSIEFLQDVLSKSPHKDYKLANAALRSNIETIEDFICNSVEGKKLINTYLSLEEPFNRLQVQIDSNIESLSSKIAMINDIIASQQGYAGAKPINERVKLRSIVEDAITIESGAFERHHIKVIRKYGEVQDIVIQKTKLINVLINILKNSVDAMQDTKKDERILKLETLEDEENIYLHISDTGIGIPNHMLKTIFFHGFTTKKNKLGFGLHSCANYMTEMGGRIWALSEGANRGAIFVLQFKKNTASQE